MVWFVTLNSIVLLSNSLVWLILTEFDDVASTGIT